MNRCLCCLQPFNETISWQMLLLLKAPEELCAKCMKQLMPIVGRRCKSCSRSFHTLPARYIVDDICLDCWRWKQCHDTKYLLEKNVSLYVYNDFLKEWLSMYKFRGDAVIGSFFARKLACVYRKQFNGYMPVEIPLSEKRLQSRRFNQTALLLQGWANETNLLSRIYEEKQSKRSRYERVARVGEQPFSINKKVTVKRIVLIDDIYTTGTTVRQAARLLKEHGVKKVASLTVAR